MFAQHESESYARLVEGSNFVYNLCQSVY